MGVHLDSIRESKLRAENRVDHEFGKSAGSDAAPVFDEGRVFGRLESTAIDRRIYVLHEMRLANRALIASLCHLPQPTRNPFWGVDLV